MKIDLNYNQIETLKDMVLDELGKQGSVENFKVFTDEYRKVVLPELDLLFEKLDDALGLAAREENQREENQREGN